MLKMTKGLAGHCAGCALAICALVVAQGSLLSQGKDRERVKIGFVLAALPGAEDSLRAQDARRGVELAIAQANDRGGVTGCTVKLVVREIRGLWGSGSKAIVDLTFEEDVQAIIGSLDGRSAHLVEQLAAKSGTPFLSAWASDRTLSGAFLPWFFQLVPDDRQQAAALFREIYHERRLERVALVSAETYDARMAATEFVRQVDSGGVALTAFLTHANNPRDREALLTTLATSNVQAVVLLGPAEQSLELIRQMRMHGVEAPAFGTLPLSDAVRDVRASKGLGEVVVADAGYRITEEGKAFRKAFLSVHGAEPGAAAAYAYDATRLLLSAIQRGGVEQAGIRASLRTDRHPAGVTGEIAFDQMGHRLTPVRLAALRGGTPQP